MLTPEEIVSCDVPDKLFMVSYIAQYYTTLKDKKPYGGKYQLLYAIYRLYRSLIYTHYIYRLYGSLIHLSDC